MCLCHARRRQMSNKFAREECGVCLETPARLSLAVSLEAISQPLVD